MPAVLLQLEAIEELLHAVCRYCPKFVSALVAEAKTYEHLSQHVPYPWILEVKTLDQVVAESEAWRRATVAEQDDILAGDDAARQTREAHEAEARAAFGARNGAKFREYPRFDAWLAAHARALMTLPEGIRQAFAWEAVPWAADGAPRRAIPRWQFDREALAGRDWRDRLTYANRSPPNMYTEAPIAWLPHESEKVFLARARAHVAARRSHFDACVTHNDRGRWDARPLKLSRHAAWWAQHHIDGVSFEDIADLRTRHAVDANTIRRGVQGFDARFLSSNLASLPL